MKYLIALPFVLLSAAASNAQQPPPGPRPAVAATAPLSPPAPPAGGAGPLARAYRDIGNAQAVNGASPYVAAAKGRYDSAFSRFRRGDAIGAAGEAGVASALARAAIDDRRFTMPSGIAAPPNLAVQAGALAPPPGGPRGLDPQALASILAIDGSSEVRTFVNRASDAAANAIRDAVNRPEEAQRQGRLARDFAGVARAIAATDHPGSAFAPTPGRGRRGRPGRF